jgi:hypothetical protein
MQTSYEPLSSKQKAELRGYVSRAVRLVRAILFLAIAFLVTASLRSIHSSFAPHDGFFSYPMWWFVPALTFMVWFYFPWRRWTGGKCGTRQIREDITRNVAAVHHIEVSDAIEVEEQEDEGPSYFILTSRQEVLYLSGQWLDHEKRKRFPWKNFDIVEAPGSKVFFGLKKAGEPFTPSYFRKALDWDSLKRFKTFSGRYCILDVDFESLKINPVVSAPKPASRK